MNYESCFRDLLESISEYKKVVLLIFLNKDDQKLLKVVGFNKNDFDQL